MGQGFLRPREAGDARGLGLFAALAGSVAGAALQLRQPALWHWLAYAALLFAALAGWGSLRSLRGWRSLAWRAPLIWLSLAMTLGAAAGFATAGWRAAVYAASALPPDVEGRDLDLVGEVVSLPQPMPGAVRFGFEVESAVWGEAAIAPDRLPPRVPERLALGWYGSGGAPWSAAGDALEAPGPVHVGQRWRLRVRLRAPHGSLNPHGYDHELRLWEQGEQASGTVRSGRDDPRPELLGRDWRAPVERLRESVRDAVFERVADRSQAGVIAALVTGDQNAIARRDWDDFRDTGVAHLVSISGLHITMFAWLARGVVGALWRRSARLCLRVPAPHAALVGGVLLATLYALFSGWGVPSQRTILMLCTVAALRLSGRRWPWPFTWLLACAAVVAVDPWALMQAGFWLSFVAVGVLFAADAGVAPAAAPAGLLPRLWRLLREQWTVTLALTPLTLLLFQQVSLVGLVANALAIPWVTLVVTPLAMAGALCPIVWQAAALSVQALTGVLHALAGWPWATVSTAAPPLWTAVAGVAGGALLTMRLPAAMRTLGLPLLLPALLWQPPRPAFGEFELLAADIGQGNAVLVRTARHGLLYDAGPRYGGDSDAGQRILVPLLRALGQRLDRVVLSHRDSDHTGGAPALLVSQPQATLLSSIEAGHPLQALRAATRCEAGQRWRWDGVDFEILHPVETDYISFADKPNAVSCVLRIGNGRATAILAGDIERLQEAALVARSAEGQRDLAADLLLVPHHGSKTSSSPRLLDAVRPRIALVQAGYRNRFGHPAREVVDRYAERGIRLADSAHCGAAGWSSRAPDRLRCERDEARRYWHHVPP